MTPIAWNIITSCIIGLSFSAWVFLRLRQRSRHYMAWSILTFLFAPVGLVSAGIRFRLRGILCAGTIMVAFSSGLYGYLCYSTWLRLGVIRTCDTWYPAYNAFSRGIAVFYCLAAVSISLGCWQKRNRALTSILLASMLYCVTCFFSEFITRGIVWAFGVMEYSELIRSLVGTIGNGVFLVTLMWYAFAPAVKSLWITQKQLESESGPRD